MTELKLRIELGMVFQQNFKYLKNEKNNLSKVILKLESLFYLYDRIYIYVPTKHGICTIMEFFSPII